MSLDADAVLAAFDAQLRRQPAGRGRIVEADERTIRVISEHGWAGVLWSGLTGADADAAIADAVRRFEPLGHPWEWKWYSYDTPVDLPERLLAAGFVRGEDEALLFAEIAAITLGDEEPEGIELREVQGAADVAAMVAVHDAAFGGDVNARMGAELLAQLEAGEPVAGVVAWAGGEPVSAGRIEFHPGTEFASLWGGATVPGFRRRGAFRAVVRHRARLAAARGHRYLQLDASPDSRPILLAAGFQRLGTTVAFTRPG